MSNELTSQLGPPATTSLAVERLHNAGLSEDDIPAVMALAATIDPADRSSLQQFGRTATERNGDLADQLLEQAKSKDLEQSGKMLAEVVSVAQSVNLNALSGRRSSLPVIGPLIDRFRTGRNKFVQQFSSTREQIDTLMSEISVTQQGLNTRVDTLDAMYESVKDEYRELGLCVVAGEVRLDQLRAELDKLSEGNDSGLHAVKRQELTHAINLLDKRVGDLRALQQSALQTLPTIRIIQSNNAMLVEKFHNIRELTIPAWKRQFMLQLSLNEQQSAVELAENIDDATNELLMRNARLTRENAVATAKANQRLVIDVETLQKVQAELIGTVQDVIRVHRDGVKARKDAEQKILEMRSDLQQKLTGAGEIETKAIAGPVH